MNPTYKRLIWIVSILCALLWFTYVWPTPWRYYKQGSVNIRVNRFTGKAQTLYSYGWR